LTCETKEKEGLQRHANAKYRTISSKEWNLNAPEEMKYATDQMNDERMSSKKRKMQK